MKKNFLLIGLFFLSAFVFAQNIPDSSFPKVDDKAIAKKAICDLGVLSRKDKTEDHKPFRITSIQNTGAELIVNDSISIKRGNSIQILLPSGKDFMFVKQQKKGLALKMLGNVADIAGTGASAVGMGTENLKTMQGSSQSDE